MAAALALDALAGRVARVGAARAGVVAVGQARDKKKEKKEKKKRKKERGPRRSSVSKHFFDAPGEPASFPLFPQGSPGSPHYVLAASRLRRRRRRGRRARNVHVHVPGAEGQGAVPHDRRRGREISHRDQRPDRDGRGAALRHVGDLCREEAVVCARARNVVLAKGARKREEETHGFRAFLTKKVRVSSGDDVGVRPMVTARS